MSSLFNQSTITTIHWRYQSIPTIPNPDAGILSSENGLTVNYPSRQRAHSRGPRHTKAVHTSQYEQLGPITHLAGDTPIGLHDILRSINIPSRYKFPRKTLLNKKRVARLFELRPLIVINGKQGYKALNHGQLLSFIIANPELRPDHFTVREVSVIPATSMFHELIFDIHVTEFTYNRVTTGVNIRKYLNVIALMFSKRDRSRKTVERTVGKDLSIEKGIAVFMNIDHREVK